MPHEPTQSLPQPDERVNTPDFWNGIYEQEGSPRWNIGVAPPLVHWLKEAAPRPGRVLVPGCGYGHDAVLLSRHGFEVVAVDFAPLAIDRARREYADEDVDWRQIDLFDLPQTEAASFDYIYEYTCMVAIQPARRAEFVQVEKALLKPGGLLVGCFYNHGREGGPPFDITRKQVLELYEPHFEIRELEVSTHSIERRMGHELWAEFAK